MKPRGIISALFTIMCLCTLISTLSAAAQKSFTRGDVNCDGVVDTAAVSEPSAHLFQLQPLPCKATGDANCSGQVTSAGIICRVGYVFKSQGPPCDICTMIPDP